MRSYWLGTVGGLMSLLLAVAILAAGVIRSIGWNRQCQAVVSVSKMRAALLPSTATSSVLMGAV